VGDSLASDVGNDAALAISATGDDIVQAPPAHPEGTGGQHGI
jgi:hypothetical protein